MIADLHYFLEKLILPQSDKARERWVAKQLKQLPKGTRLLDAGAGECQYKKYCDHLDYVSQDFAAYDGKGDGSGLHTGTRDSSRIDIVSDIISMPVKAKEFDAVLCVEVFEHLPAPLEALKEFSRVIKKDGVLILTAPFSSLTHYSPYYYYSGFSINFYKENLPKFGFEIDEVYSYGNYFDTVALELARIPLVCIRTIGVLALPILLAYILVLPSYILLRFLSFIMPDSSGLACFGICIRAHKTASSMV